MSHLGHENTEYKNFSVISIDTKPANASWLKLQSLNTLPHPYVLIYKTKNLFLPVIIYEMTPFDNSSGHSQILQNVIMTLMSLSHNQQENKTNKKLLGGIMKGIGFCSGSDSGKSTGVYSTKEGLTPHQIETDNNQWTKFQQYAKFVYIRSSNFSKLAANENQ
ncbi:hypothetical protein O181_122778 [Austropuccinia psidii MF-1]|uniref:Uncharacterized protein n=1 Tax=Austropuccinia psidii MF-1 TaxID=1389203 RepID=A0A9Q3KK03_9BASI|nr:hypothetical protein [Austropuccinia psidii MF-1]